MRLLSPFLVVMHRPDHFRTGPRRPRRLRPGCEGLESRQLLSVDLGAGSFDQITAEPNLTASPLVSSGPTGLSPQQIRGAYGVNSIVFSGGITGTGAGQTIAIVDAYHDPTITADLATFDAQFGLAAPPSFTVKNLGSTRTDAGWALETALDVEWAHALAPGANLVLVEASSASLGGLLSAVSYASALPGVSVVSMSWGTNEFYGEWAYTNIFTTPLGHNNVAYVAASGDAGAWSGPSFPSVLPNVLAVGGTTLTAGSGNTYGSERGWTDSTGGFSGLDNGFRYGMAMPSYQSAALTAAGLNYGLRTTPDVSFDADPASGVPVYDSISYGGQSGWFEVGGTSASAPAWAGLVAIADQGLAGGGKGTLSTTQLLTQLYALPGSDFHDITSGFNGYSARAGYDLVTGLGTPKANLVVAGLLAANGVVTSSAAVGSPATSAATVHSTSSPSSTRHFVEESSTVTGRSPSSSEGEAAAISEASLPSGAIEALTTTSTTPAQPSSLPAPALNPTAATAALSPTAAGPGLVVSTTLGQGLSSSTSRPGGESSLSDPQPVSPIELDREPAPDPGPPAPAPVPDPESRPPASMPDPGVADPAQGGLLPNGLDAIGDPAARIVRSVPFRGGASESSDSTRAGSDGTIAGLFGVAVVAAGGYRLVQQPEHRERRRRPVLSGHLTFSARARRAGRNR